MMNSLAAGTFFENFQIAHTFGSPTFQVPPGPAASGRTYVSLKTFGFVSSVVRNAEIASWIQLATPEARYRLSDASSQENTSGVMPSSNSALANRSASRVSLESRSTFCPEASLSCPPKLARSDRQLRFASLQWENWIPHGCPFAFRVRAATRASSQVSGGFRPFWSKRSLRQSIGSRM